VRIGLDASAAAKARRTGVGHYVARLSDALLAEPDVSLTLGVRLGRWRRRAHLHRPTGPGADRGKVSWFPSFWPGLAFGSSDLVHGPDARVVGGSLPQVVTLHDLFSLKSESYSDDAFRAKKAGRYAEIAAKAARVCCVSESTARDAMTILGIPRERIAVTPLGVDPWFSPRAEEDRAPVLERLGVRPPYVLFVGLAQPRKNLETIATVFGRLAARKDDLTLVIAGDDGYPEGRLHALLEQTGAVDRVKRTGYVSEAELPALYSAAGLLLFPSRDEGFGLPVLEAMACGCPVVASDRGALPEVVGDGGLCFPPDAFDAIEEAAARLLEDEGARMDQIARGRLRAAQFSWARTAQATLEAYRGALGLPA
jgi:glycosyltransferase involved in cell wall biosynthesis